MISNHEEREQHSISTFALDVYWASGKKGDAALERHLDECARCRSYLAQLDGIATMPAPPAFRVREENMRARRAWGRAAAGAAAIVALAAIVMLLVRPAHDDREDGYVGVKGTPAVQAVIRSAGQSRIWDGRSPLHPGDAIALRVSCDRFARVAILAPADDGGWNRLSEGACPASTAPLPFTLIADEKAGDERVAIVFSEGSLTDAELETAAQNDERTRRAWVVALTFRKSTEGR